MMSQIDLFAWPRFGVQTARTNFGSPPDLRARYGNGVNDYGQLVIEATLGNESSPDGRGRLVADSPYEMNLFPEGADSPNGQLGPDAPFSLGELERMLRAYDTDSYTLPDRLTQLGGNASDVNRERNRITAESWSIPGPQVTLPHEMRELLADAANPLLQRLPRSTAELFEIRVRAALNRVDSTLYPLFPTPITDLAARDRVRRVMRQLLAPELAAGMKLNVNRPFGNG
ncbi:MAG TPA: hypothetical protein VEQ85_08375, partial [Lacipirellulaceae bacterium]|nr:hypothetical protein [Lacipirellulaceae bacterium]